MSIYSDTAPVSPHFWDPDNPHDPPWVVKPTNWRARALCRTEGHPDDWFPVGRGIGAPALAQIRKAKAVCRRCKVRGDCLDWALENGEDHGVWGGFSEDERRAMRKKASA